MKKLISILLLAFYLFSVEGINLHRHFCGGSVADVSLFSKMDEKNCCGDKPCNECYDDHVSFKINQEHVGKIGVEQEKRIQLLEGILQPEKYYDLVSVSLINIDINKYLSFPLAQRTRDKLYTLHCSWLI